MLNSEDVGASLQLFLVEPTVNRNVYSSAGQTETF